MNFQCQATCGGKCCTFNWDGHGGFVFLTKTDRKRLVKELKAPLESFANKAEFKFTRFTNKHSVQWYLNSSGKNCRFFKDGKCAVYAVRPTQCRTFPFWPENMAKEKWAELETFCPGINKGFEVTHARLAEQIEADKELCNQLK